MPPPLITITAFHTPFVFHIICTREIKRLGIRTFTYRTNRFWENEIGVSFGNGIELLIFVAIS